MFCWISLKGRHGLISCTSKCRQTALCHAYQLFVRPSNIFTICLGRKLWNWTFGASNWQNHSIPTARFASKCKRRKRNKENKKKRNDRKIEYLTYGCLLCRDGLETLPRWRIIWSCWSCFPDAMAFDHTFLTLPIQPSVRSRKIRKQNVNISTTLRFGMGEQESLGLWSLWLISQLCIKINAISAQASLNHNVLFMQSF